MKKRNDRGIALIIFALIIVAVLAIAFTAIYFIFYKTSNVSESITPSGTQVSKVEEKLDEKVWDKRIISDLTQDEIPIPNGFTYLQGDKRTGLIIKATESENLWLFIPYDENASNDVNDYYKKASNYTEMDFIALTSIKKYGGFFIELNSSFKMDDLKTIDKSNYEFQFEQLQLIYDDAKGVKPHILYKEEIQQVKNYIEKNNINLGENTLGIQSFIIDVFSNVNENELVLESNGEKLKTSQTKKVTARAGNSKTNTTSYVYKYKTTSALYGGTKNKKVEIPIPSGFNYGETDDGVIMIQDKKNDNMIYIWVPLKYNDIDTVKNRLWSELYSKSTDYNGDKPSKNSELYDLIMTSTDDSSVSGLKDSLKKFNGFYISQAELSMDKNLNYMNTARGMVSYSVSNTTKGGDYIRGENYNINKSDIISLFKNATINSNNSSSVTSHIMYGLEYDATLLWIADTYKDKNIYNTLCTDSINYGKYSNSMTDETASASSIKMLNNIWGLGGNLFELTQEKSSKKKGNLSIIRGGSYQNSSEDAPIACRRTIEDLKHNNIGIRTALYIDKNAITATTKNNNFGDFEYNGPDDDIKTEVINNQQYEVEIKGNRTRYVNSWDRVKIYSEPNINSNVIKELSMAESVEVYSKASNSVTSSDGTEIVWAKVILGNNQYGYINAKNLTEAVSFYNDSSIEFINSQKSVKRYYKANTKIYSAPDDNTELWSTAFAGSIEILGKSLDQKWATFMAGDEYRFVHTSDLTVSTETVTTIDKKVFIKSDKVDFWIIEDNTKMYSIPVEDYEIKTLNKGTKISVDAISDDGNWLKIAADSTLGFILTSKADAVEPAIEPTTTTQSQKTVTGDNVTDTTKKETKFTTTNDVVYVTASSINIRSSCDSSVKDNILGQWSYGTPVNRIAKGDNGWDKVHYRGTVAYLASKYLSTTKPAEKKEPSALESRAETDNNNKEKNQDKSQNNSTNLGLKPIDYIRVNITSDTITTKINVVITNTDKAGSIKSILFGTSKNKTNMALNFTTKTNFNVTQTATLQYNFKNVKKPYYLKVKTDKGYSPIYEIK